MHRLAPIPLLLAVACAPSEAPSEPDSYTPIDHSSCTQKRHVLTSADGDTRTALSTFEEGLLVRFELEDELEDHSRVHTITYDANGCMLSKLVEGRWGDADPRLLEEVTATCDGNGNPLTVESFLVPPIQQGTLDPWISSTVYTNTYDADDRLTDLVTERYDEADTLMSTFRKRYEYNADGNVVEERSYFDGILTSLATTRWHNAHYFAERLVEPAAGGGELSWETITLDERGRPIEQAQGYTQPNGVEDATIKRWTWDARDVKTSYERESTRRNAQGDLMRADRLQAATLAAGPGKPWTRRVGIWDGPHHEPTWLSSAESDGEVDFTSLEEWTCP